MRDLDAPPPLLTAEDCVASAVATLRRPDGGTFGLSIDERIAVSNGAHERVKTLQAAARAHVMNAEVRDLRCGGRVTTVVAFVLHCADVDHTIRDVEVLDREVHVRDLGRQGESRTAVSS